MGNEMKVALLNTSSLIKCSSGTNNALFVPTTLSPIGESPGHASERSLLKIPHLDSHMDPLIALANCRTTKDASRRLKYIEQVDQSERLRLKQQYAQKVSAPVPLRRLPPVTINDARKKVPFLPRSRGTIGAFGDRKSERQLESDGEEFEGAGEDDISVGTTNSINTFHSLPAKL